MSVMSTAEWGTLLVLCTTMSFSPGPNTTLSTALAANRGLRAALRFCLAVPVGWTLLLLACGLGVGVLVAQAPVLRWAIKLAGAAYLLWLAWRLARSSSLGNAAQARLNVGFWQGVALQFLNIKAWMLALTLVSGWVIHAGAAPSSNPGERLAAIAVAMVFFAFASNFTYALVGAGLRGWLAHGRRLQVFNLGLALVLAGTAAWMLTT